MKARELMRDGPTIKELFDRCISTDYEVDSHDFFYMQAMSERLSLRYPDFNPADGHWYGPSVCVAGGYVQRRMRELDYSNEVLDANRDLIDMSIAHEVKSEGGDLTRGISKHDEIKKIILPFYSVHPPLRSITIPLMQGWLQKYKSFLSVCETFEPQNFADVNFSDPVFDNTELFKPLIENKELNFNQFRYLSSTSSHDLHPFTSHLSYYFRKKAAS